MAESKKVSKAEILSGKDYEQTVYFEELGGEVTLRPLTEKQYGQVTAIKSAATKLVGGAVYDEHGNVDQQASTEQMQVEVDIGRSQELELEADATAVAYSMTTDGEKWNVDEVLSMRPIGIVKKIAAAVYELSGVTKGRVDTAKPFRGKRPGPGNSHAAPNRAASGK